MAKPCEQTRRRRSFDGVNHLLTTARPRCLVLQSLVGIILSYELLFGESVLIGSTASQALVAGFLLLIIGLASVPSRILERTWFAGALVGLNTVSVTATIYVSGNARTDLYICYFLLILVAASVRRLAHMLGFSLVLCAGYSLVLYEGVVESGIVSSGHLLGIPVLLVMAVVYGLTLESLASERQQKAALQGSIEELRRTEQGLLENRAQLEARLKELRGELATAQRGLRQGALEREGLERRLRDAQKMEAVARMAGKIASEFGALLATIARQTGTILSTLKPGDPARQPVEDIFRVGERAATLTAQLEAVQLSAETPVASSSLNWVLAENENILRSFLPPGVELEMRLDPMLPWVEMGRDEVEQILFHLVANARDALATGGRLCIETRGRATPLLPKTELRRDRSMVLLAVSDTGPGMTLETQAKIFEPFFSTKETKEGLGLTRVYKLARQAGGLVEVESLPGKGTTVRVYLPHSEAKPLPPEPAVPNVEPDSVRPTLLLVEEDEVERKLAVAALSRHRYQVLEAGSAVEALMLAQQHGGSIDLTISRLVLQDIDGRDLAQRLLTLRPRMKALFVSPYPDDSLTYHRINRRYVLQRPYPQRQLVDKVRETLGEI
jgi:signal transduction histidine kinase